MGNRQVMALIVVAAVAAGLGLWLGLRPPQGAGAAPPVQAALLYPAPREIAEFELARADGGRFVRADLEGRWTLAFFGFTHCPDICPTALATMKQVAVELAARQPAPPLQVLFVSVDPERDTPQVLGDYARYFGEEIVAVTGGEAALAPFARQFGIVYMKSPLEGGGYTVDHSSQVVLVGPDARIHGLFRPPLDATRIAADLVLLADARS